MSIVVMIFAVEVGPDLEPQEALENVEMEINFEGYEVLAKTVTTHEEAVAMTPRRP